MDRVRGSPYLETYLKCCNVNAIDRLGLNDHGPTHIRIIANKGLKLLRMLMKNGIHPSIVRDYRMTTEDAEIVVFLACVLHDIGHMVHRTNHADYSIPIALGILQEMLSRLYDEERKAIVIAETLHPMRTHEADATPLTVEAGVVRLADALDMEKGRARIPFEAGSVNIHSVSALAIDKVGTRDGNRDRPIIIEIHMSNPAGVYQIDELLRKKLKDSKIEAYVKVVASVEAGGEKKTLQEIAM